MGEVQAMSDLSTPKKSQLEQAAEIVCDIEGTFKRDLAEQTEDLRLLLREAFCPPKDNGGSDETIDAETYVRLRRLYEELKAVIYTLSMMRVVGLEKEETR
jgi:hypothetical protein